jgi:peptide/nickel transport system substrate-binding protein
MKRSLLIILVVMGLLLSACGPTDTEPTQAPTEAAAPADTTAPEATKAPEPTEEPEPTEAPLPGADKQGGILVMGFADEPEMLNSYLVTHAMAKNIGAFMQRGLLEVLADGTYVPDLTTEVPTVRNGGVSEDGLTVTYRLREGIVWEDGDSFDCEDVKFTHEAIMHPESGAVSTGGYKDIVSVTCPDPQTAVMEYGKFYAPYLTLFDVILPSHLGLDPAAMTEWEYNRNPLSIGPYSMVEWESGDHITVTRNEKYELWESEGKPYIDDIIMRFLGDSEVGKQLIQTGEIDFLYNLTETDIPEAEGMEGITISAIPSRSSTRLVLNLRDPEVDAPCKEELLEDPHWHWALGDLKVRQAIQYGIDKNFITEKLLHGVLPVAVANMNIGWAAADIPESEYNPETAKDLLEEAGWTDTDDDGIRECHGCPYAEEGTALRLRYTTTAGNKMREDAQQLIIEMMKEIGIEFYAENMPQAEIGKSYAQGGLRRHGHYDIMMYSSGHAVDPHNHIENYFASWNMPCDANSGKGANYSRWASEEFDALMEEASSTPDMEARAEAYQRANELLVEGLPHIFLYQRLRVDLYVDNLRGFERNDWGSLAWNAEEWWLE